MTRNPSRRQIIASRENLRGQHGPKTTAGKKICANNGFKNKGAKSAKAKAKAILERWGESTKSFYSYAGCAYCELPCLWSRFSIETYHSRLPLACLRKVLQEDPGKCFYYFNGVCCASNSIAYQRTSACILDAHFLDNYINICPPGRSENYEMDFRKNIYSKKREATRYISQLKRSKNQELSPRMLYVFRFLQPIIHDSSYCQLEPWRKFSQNDEDIDWLLNINVNNH